MAHAYTPGLKVKKFTLVTKTRRLPLPGDVLVAEGEQVTHDQIVARTEVPGEVHLLPVAGPLGIEPEDINRYMVKKLNEMVGKNEPLAKRTSFFGLLSSSVIAPEAGTIEMISNVTGQIALRRPPIPVEVTAYVPGEVAQVIPREGVTIRTHAAMVQGIFGVGGEAHAPLEILAETPEETLTAEKVTSDCKGKVIVGGALVTMDALRKAVETGVKGVVVGGVEDEDLIKFLGQEIGVAITGHEEIGITLIITEGFGKMNMPHRTFNLLKTFNGRDASINGATQIRAGVIRPEIIMPLTEQEIKQLTEEREEVTGGMGPGTPIRIIRDPYFGAIGHVINLPVQLATVQSESQVRIVEVQLENGETVTVPRANVEIIEE
jgi:hypothetical protein